MDDLKRYVDRLFAGYKETGEIGELKDEILSNLEAKMADYTAEGMPQGEAFALATRSIKNVDFLVEGNQPVYRNRFTIELAQAGLLYLVIAWILTIPLRLMFSGVLVNNLLTLFVVAGIAIYVAISYNKEDLYLNTVTAVNTKKLMQFRKVSWLVWGLYLAVSTSFTSVKYFGSDIWFGRPLKFDGPYQFAVIAVSYALPMIAIILPLLFSKAVKLAEKYEAPR